MIRKLNLADRSVQIAGRKKCCIAWLVDAHCQKKGFSKIIVRNKYLQRLSHDRD